MDALQLANKVMEITKCPHTHRKHYAKVHLSNDNLFRICAQAAIESMVEIKTPGHVLIQLACYIQWACAKLATCQIIIK